MSFDRHFVLNDHKIVVILFYYVLGHIALKHVELYHMIFIFWKYVQYQCPPTIIQSCKSNAIVITCIAVRYFFVCSL